MNDMYNTFYNTKLCYGYCPCKHKYKFNWCYGDTVNIKFRITDRDCDEVSNFEDCTIIVSFYNFRSDKIFEKVFTQNDIDAESLTVTVTIDKETSSKLFKKGNYTCDVVIEESEDTTTTVLSTDKCSIYVK